MSNFTFLRNSNQQLEELKTLQDPAGNFDFEYTINDDLIFSVSYLKNNPLNVKRLYENEKWIILFSGDIIEFQYIYYQKIINYLEKKDYENFKSFNGIFAILAFDKTNSSCYLISDSRSSHPLYYYIEEDKFIFSTQLSVFTRFIPSPEFDENWLYNYLFFNYPVFSTTFLKNVNRIPRASILHFNLKANSYNISYYSNQFKKREPLIDGKEALDYAVQIFQKRMPEYFECEGNIACALTSGWDARTYLALAPDYSKIFSYTYGIPGCKDLTDARITTDITGIKHKSIYFTENFLNQIQNLSLESVYISSGLQGILRSTLLYTFRELKESINNLQLIISGISLDRLFRGHEAVPSFISPHVAKIFQSGNIYINKNYWQNIFNNYNSFNKEIEQKLILLKDIFGDFRSAYHHLLYDVYVAQPNYFCGEVRIANNFCTMRVPAWDNEITSLAFSIKYSTLSYSQHTGFPKGTRNEVILQSYIIKKLAPVFSKIPVRHTKPNIVLKGEAIYQGYSIYKKASQKISKIIHKKNHIPLEDWHKWINLYLKDFIDELIFSNDSLIRNYFTEGFLNNIKSSRDIQLIGKLATTEIILKLINNRWQKFW